MCDALEDYANILDGVIKDWGLEGYKAFAYELHAARCRKIARKYAKAIGYDRERTLEKCHKRRDDAGDDIGEEALMLLEKYGSKKAKAARTEKPATTPKPPEEDPAEQMSLLPEGGAADG